FKPVSTIGLALGNDVCVKGDRVAQTHAQILFDGRDFNLEEVDKQGDILINGKKKRRARLVHGDRLTLGDAELAFSMFDEPRSTPRPDHATPAPNPALTETQLWSASQSIAGIRKLFDFSEKLMTLKSVDEVLEAMLDAVIDVSGAEKGLILLLDDDGDKSEEAPTSAGSRLRIRAARNVHKEAVSETAI